MLSNNLILCCPLLLLPSIFPLIRVFSKESALRIRCPKYWSSNISHSNEYSESISYRIDWFDLLAVQGTLKNLLQHRNSKESNLQCSAFFMVQLSYPYITAGKTVALTIWIFASKVMSLLSYMLFRFFIALLPSWLSQKRICLQCRRSRFDSWVGMIPWRREYIPTLAWIIP